MTGDACDTCGGSVDADQATTCLACQYERITGRRYEADVNEARRQGIPFIEFARRQVLAARVKRVLTIGPNEMFPRA